MQILTRMHQLRAPWMAWWLALALVVAPALGRMHEVLHAPGLPQAHVAITQAHHTHDAHQLFGEHTTLECLALDQLCHAMEGSTELALAGHALPSIAPTWSADPAALPADSPVFLARAPPRVNA